MGDVPMGIARKIQHTLRGLNGVGELRAMCVTSGLNTSVVATDVLVAAKLALDIFVGPLHFGSNSPDPQMLALMKQKCGASIKEAAGRASHYRAYDARGYHTWKSEDIEESISKMVQCGHAAQIPGEAIQFYVHQTWEMGYKFFFQVLDRVISGKSYIETNDIMDRFVQNVYDYADNAGISVDEDRLDPLASKIYTMLYKNELKLAARAIQQGDIAEASSHINGARRAAVQGGFTVDGQFQKVLQKIHKTLAPVD